jgi:hypothetical protein
MKQKDSLPPDSAPSPHSGEPTPTDPPTPTPAMKITGVKINYCQVNPQVSDKAEIT